MNEERIQAEYERLHEYGVRHEATPHFRSLSDDYRGGIWRHSLPMLSQFEGQIAGRTVLDFGCKYGHLIPAFMAMGAKRVIGVDAETIYVDAGHAVFSALYPGCSVVLCRDGLIPVESDCIDFVIMTEVISHVNPTVLPLIWAELGRIMRVGGAFFISDTKNLDHPGIRFSAAEYYGMWENGPDGAKTCWDTIDTCYLQRRIRVIRGLAPALSEEAIRELALNTSGLFGRPFAEVVEQFLRTGVLTKRPYRKGICPTNPGASGVVMERAFTPPHLMQDLEHYGFETEDLALRDPEDVKGIKRKWAGALVRWLEATARRLRRRYVNNPILLLATKKW